MRSETSDGFSRLGSFVQISRHLVNRLWIAIRESKGNVEKVNTKVCGVKQIMMETIGI